MTRARAWVFIVAVVVFAGWPAGAYAASDILGFLGELSGPGPWKINFAGVEERLWCQPTAAASADSQKQKFADCLLDRPDKTRAVVSFQATWAGTGVTQLFKDDPSDVREAREFTMSVAYMYRVSSFFQVGAGASFMHFYSGDAPDKSVNPSPNPDFGFTRLGLIPARVTLTPFGTLGSSNREKAVYRLVSLQFETTWIPQGFSGSDFNNSKTAYKVGGDYQTRAVVILDGAAAIRAIWNK